MVAVTGTAGVLMVAKEHRKLVYTVAGTHMFCPMTTCGPYGLLERGPPDITLPYNPERCRPATILSEYIKNGLVDCFITNNGLIAPNCINRTIMDMYHTTQCDLF
ncbi:hypothetical protein C7212DRAFT_337331 [Tuber magnatum]|uniref:Uncharacterized protein n=1 Tax=Tuber magnatum TaxID=42249 RepID=A0A317SBJ2_9PEZI|nr:hypothetical protein C7212DRAFT_337331 [Tuber magnatum]